MLLVYVGFAYVRPNNSIEHPEVSDQAVHLNPWLHMQHTANVPVAFTWTDMLLTPANTFALA